MPHYLFSNDFRNSELSNRIKWAADLVHNGKELKSIENKSDNNNAATLAFYFNLFASTQTLEIATKEPIEVIKNFVLKFQFPNTRQKESFADSIKNRIFLAPYRAVVSVLCAMKKIEPSKGAYITLDEILYYIFCNPYVYKNPSFPVFDLANQIVSDRLKNIDVAKLENLISSKLTWNQYNRQIREMMNILTSSSNCFNLHKGVLSYIPIESEKRFIEELTSYSYIWYPSNVDNFSLASKEYSSYLDMADTPYTVIDMPQDNSILKENLKKFPLQQIYYGAPGTGKSYDIDRITKTYSTIRTTFHPDSDYSTFVGAYKPTMTKSKVYGAQGPLQDGGEDVMENRITYTFIKQAFLKAYLGAWKKYADGGEQVQPQFLVIEEINRGNCAQIFGDLFQLLDRSSNGFSTYPIEADADLQKEIENAFSEDKEYKIEGDFDVEGAVKGYTSNYGASLSEDIKSGRVLLLPNNLYIWATMNTSDQSLFPIDSAFKRRWDWKYVRITNGYERDEEGHFKLDNQGQRVPLNWQIKVDAETKFDWWEFIQAINKKIADTTSSDDKKLGYFFCKPQGDSKTIDAETFVGKVIFYLWNDVFKDEDADIFKLSATSPTFDQFYTEDAKTGDVKADTEVVRLFLVDKLELKPLENNENEGDDVEDEDGNTSSATTRNYDKFSINDKGEYPKNRLAAESVKEYIHLHPDMSAEDVLSNWKSLGMIVPHFIESQKEYEERTDKSTNRVEAIPCGSETIYVAIDGYGSNGKADVLMNAVNQKDWGIRIAKLD